MSTNSAPQAVLQAADVLTVLNAARRGNFKARIPATDSVVPRKVAEGLNHLLEINARAAREIEELRKERKELLRTLQAVEKGDFTARASAQGTPSPVVETLNNVIAMNEKVAEEFERVGRVVGKEGKLFERASLKDARGSWGTSVAAVNTLIGDLVQPTIEVARVIGEVAKGNLSRTMPMEIEGRQVKGAFIQMANTINTMVGQLKAFASEVTRVAREVRTEGKLGGQAEVKGVAGAWKDLTDNVNSMARNLTNQVRNIADVTTAVAKGDLSRTITVEAKGEIRQLKDTINTMVDQLKAFASEVTRVAREVGTDGKQAGLDCCLHVRSGGQRESRSCAGAFSFGCSCRRTFGYLIGGFVVHHNTAGEGASAFFITPLVDQSTRTYGLHVEFAPSELNLRKAERFIGRLQGTR